MSVSLCFSSGDLNADPGVFPCFSSGKFVDLALACSLRAGRKPDATCMFKLDECAGSRRDFMVGCPNALTASAACTITERWFTPHFPIADFCISRWTAEVACPVPFQQVWPACWIDIPDRSPSCSSGAVQDAWDVYREELEVPLGFVPSSVGVRCVSVLVVGP